jgi:hypothetical protein
MPGGDKEHQENSIRIGTVKDKGKVRPRTGHEDPEGE